METPTRYDLNAAIENWRVELAAQLNLTVDVRRELETHLRDAIAGFQQRGLNDEESFWLARRRVGQPPKLGEEFAKADLAAVWRVRVFWMCAAVFLSSTLGGIANSVYMFFPHFLPVNANSTVGIAMQTTLYLLASLSPIIIAVLLAKGKLIAVFSKLTLIVENRLYLAIAAFICIVISSSIRIIALSNFGSFNPGYIHYSWRDPNLIKQILFSAVYPLIIARLLVWLVPPQNRKTPKRA